MKPRPLIRRNGSGVPHELGTWHVRLLWEPRDLWLGAYRDTANRRLYVCVLPCLPIVIERSA